MNRFVYLFELDSVRNEPNEIMRAQRALFHEIVMNGNTVVLSFNQLTDSEAFLSLLKEETTYEQILELFRLGAIRVSRYGNYRTPSQYVQASIDKCLKETVETRYFYGETEKIDKSMLTPYKQEPTNLSWPIQRELYSLKGAFFENTDAQMQKKYDDFLDGKDKQKDTYLFSGIPVKSTERELLKAMKDALQYNALDILKEWKDKNQDNGAQSDTDECAEEKERLSFLVLYVNMLITMSLESLASNPPKTSGGRTFADYLEKLIQIDYEVEARNANIADERFVFFANEAKKILKNMFDAYKASGNKGIENRSLWIKEINENATSKMIESAESMAIAIIDMCYNYKIEDSILNISKRYDENEAGAFEKDYIEKLYAYWKDILNGEHTLTSDKKEFHPGLQKTKIPWKTAVRVAAGNRKDTSTYECSVMTEKEMEKETRKWKRRRTKNQFIYFFYTTIYIVVFCVVEWMMGMLEGAVANLGIPQGFLYDVIVSMVLFGILGSIVSDKLNLPDILESMKNIGSGFLDCYNIYKASRENRKEKSDIRKK